MCQISFIEGISKKNLYRYRSDEYYSNKWLDIFIQCAWWEQIKL